MLLCTVDYRLHPVVYSIASVESNWGALQIVLPQYVQL